MKKKEVSDFLAAEVTEREKKKGQLHKVFTDSPAYRQAGLMPKEFTMKSFLIRK